MDDHNRLFNRNKQAWKIDTIPNGGVTSPNSSLASAMEHGVFQEVAAADPDAIPMSHRSSGRLAELFPDEVDANGRMSTRSTARWIQHFRSDIHATTSNRYDFHFAHLNKKGEPVLSEPRDVLPGHHPVVILDRGGRYEALVASDDVTGSAEAKRRAVYDFVRKNSEEADGARRNPRR